MTTQSIKQRTGALSGTKDAQQIRLLLEATRTELVALRTTVAELTTDHATTKTSYDAMETLIEELHDDHATTKTAVDETKTLDDELHDDAATNKTLLDEIKTAINELARDNVITATTLAIGSTPEEYSHAAFTFRINGVTEAIALDASLAFTAADTINTGAAAGTFWGGWRVQVTTGGTVSTKSVGADQVYATEAAAIAAIPAADADNADVGYITVESNTGAAWTMITDDLTPASDCVSANYYNTVAPCDIINSSAATLAASKATAGPATLTAAKPASGPGTLSAAALAEVLAA